MSGKFFAKVIENVSKKLIYSILGKPIISIYLKIDRGYPIFEEAIDHLITVELEAQIDVEDNLVPGRFTFSARW